MPNIIVRNVIQEVQSLYSKGVKSKDSRLSSRHIYSIIIKNRATLLKQQLNKNQEVSPWSYQPLECVELIQSPIKFTEQIFLRTKYKLPTAILDIGSKSLCSITSTDGQTKFDRTTFSTYKYSVGKKYTSRKPSFYLYNQHGYINYSSKLKGVNIYDLFYDPIEATLYPSLCDDKSSCNCKDYMDFEFPIDGDTLNSVIKLASNELILFTQMKEDRQNNASDDNQSNNQMIHQPRTDE